MFTGIIKKTAIVKNTLPAKGGFAIEITNPFGRLKKGDSISVNGVCSTVKKTGKTMAFDYMPETLKLTNIGKVKKGDTVNLEQPMRLGDRLDGHMVLGHIDCTGNIISIKQEGNSRAFTIEPSNKKQRKLVVFKGSVAVEGISLTVAAVTKNSFTVKIIPYTWQKTNLQFKKKGDRVNIEFDILGKYANQR